jgi:preprotein translocase subunit SecA
VYLTARLTADSDVKELTERIITHLEEALGILQAARGRMAWNRLSQTETNLEKLSESLRDQIAETLGKEKFEELATRQFETFSAEEHSLVEQVLGWRLQVEAYRELLLHSISDQWIDYLTKVEALRVSIGLEAYAQRDPLVQYKGQASEMFKQLLADIRAGVIHRLFTYQSRGMVGLMPVEKEAGNVAPQVGQSPVQTNRSQQLQPGQGGGGKKKRKRH